jgi:hypothetical protein
MFSNIIEMSETISVFLTTSQKNKMNSGKTFQLSASALQAGSGKHAVDIEMTTKNYKTLVNNVSKNKGYRFTADKIVGSGFFKDIGKMVAKKVAPKILDKIGEKTGQKGITNALKGSVDGLVDIGADKITGGKMKKGSPEMAAHMARLRSMRKGKGMQTEIEGEGIFEDLGRDIKRGFNKTFNPKLGRKIKDAFTSKPAREVYKGLANAGLRIGSSFTGLPLSLAQGEIDRQIDGASIKRSNAIIEKGSNIVNGVPRVQVRGRGFTGKNGTKFGGSFKELGGSMVSP